MQFSLWLLMAALVAAENDTTNLEEVPRGGFTLPPYPGSRWGPFFEDDLGPINVTARIGSLLRMDCRIGMLHDKTVTWVKRRKESIHLLTVGRQAYSSDQRISLSFRYPNNWRLEISYVTRRDEGMYECQIATHPPKVRKIFLDVTGCFCVPAPEVRITDDKEAEVSERYYRVGSSVELTCRAVNLDANSENATWRHGESAVPPNSISVNSSVKDGTAVLKITLKNAQREHSGNYTCNIGLAASASVYVHILNGELPAAVQDESSKGVSSILATTWLLYSSLLLAQYSFHGR